MQCNALDTLLPVRHESSHPISLPRPAPATIITAEYTYTYKAPFSGEISYASATSATAGSGSIRGRQ